MKHELWKQLTSPAYWWNQSSAWLFVAFVVWFADKRQMPLWAIWQFALIGTFCLFSIGLIIGIAVKISEQE